MTRPPVTDGLRASLDAAEGYDWDALRAAIDLGGGLRNTVLMAEIPRHPPIRVMRSVSEGVEPFFLYERAGEPWADHQRNTPFSKD
jgi:hypothetical protein